MIADGTQRRRPCVAQLGSDGSATKSAGALPTEDHDEGEAGAQKRGARKGSVRPGSAIGQIVTLAQVYGLLTEACAASGGQKAWAYAHDISPSHVCDVLNTRRDPGPALLAALGLVRQVSYVRVSIPNR